MTERTPRVGHESIFVARQPIFTADQDVWGYELLFRATAQAAAADVDNPDRATAHVIVDGYYLALQNMPKDVRLLINFPQGLLLKDAAFALPEDGLVVEVLEDVTPDEDVLAALERLRSGGYTLAMDDYMGEEHLAPLVARADIVKVDVLGLGGMEQACEVAARLTRGAKGRPLRLLAEKVEDLASFEALRDCGYSLFQGYFFSRPETLPGTKISTGNLAKLQLIQELGGPDTDMERIAEIVNTDVSLSYRLLRTINSARYGLRQKVDSVRRATHLLGKRRLAQWLRVVILADMAPTRRARETAYLCVLRGRFLEQASGQAPAAPNADTLFTLGMFSLLDGLLNQPMSSILDELALSEELKATLLGERTPLAPLLELARSLERAGFDRAEALARRLGLEPEAVFALHGHAQDWAAVRLGMGGDEDEGVEAED